METEKEMENKLQKEGWHLLAQVVHQTLDKIVQMPYGEYRGSFLEEVLRTELLDNDIRCFGARSLPDAETFLHSRALHGPRVLQLLTVIDINQSSKRATAGCNQHSRLLRFRLTDGHTTVTPIEFRPIPSVSPDLPPGTKVLLENTVPVHTGVLLLDVNCVRVLGGHVQTMYDAWEMDRKYSGIAREAVSKSLLPGVTGPPPFRALQLGRKSRPGNGSALQGAKQDSNSYRTQPVKGDIREDEDLPAQVKKEEASTKPKPAIRPGAEPYRPRVGGAIKDGPSTVKSNSVERTPLPPKKTAETDYIPGEQSLDLNCTKKAIVVQSIPAGRVLSVDERLNHRDQIIRQGVSFGIDNTPLQNRKAAQKLLEKTNASCWKRGDCREAEGRARGNGWGGRRREQTDDAFTMTLSEWEARKSCGNSSISDTNVHRPDGSYSTDRELARKLQHELDLESLKGGPSREIDPAEHIRANMFNFAPGVPAGDEDPGGRGRAGVRRRGRGRRLG